MARACYGIQDLDVPDLRLDLRRSRRRAGRRHRPRHPLGRRADQLDLPGMRRAQGRFRDGRDLSGHYLEEQQYSGHARRADATERCRGLAAPD
ncbi:conserved hypothetical protein [Cupriavidus taiwanensis]|nr:conserved hypothetical protein [Cupriavidus taiwanensis]